MLTRERLIEILRGAKHTCAHDLYTDENGLCFFAGIEKRTARDWRRLGKGPAALDTGKRIVYDLDGIIEWYNAPSQKKTGGKRRKMTAKDVSRQSATSTRPPDASEILTSGNDEGVSE